MREFGLLGFPLGHSKSKVYFNEKFKNENIDAKYHNFEVENISILSSLVKKNPQIQGFNVTIPHKEAVIPFLDKLTRAATLVEAVNVIKIVEEGLLEGHNTDIIGFKKSFTPLLQPLYHKKALILGTGGASKAVAYILDELNIEYLFVSRNPLNAKEISYSETSQWLGEYAVVINTTPLGTFPNIHTFPAIDYNQLSTHHYLYDLVYNPSETLFLKQGKAQGAQTKNGEDMFILQAEASWEIWTNT